MINRKCVEMSALFQKLIQLCDKVINPVDF